MKGRDFFWVYIKPGKNHQGQALNGACSWCSLPSDNLKKATTSDGERLQLCFECLKLARRVSVGSFAIPRIAVPMISRKRNKND